MYNRLIRTLIEVYGAIVRSEYHLQIPVGDHFHDIWIGNKGLKWRLQGMRYSESGWEEDLLQRLGRYNVTDSDLAWMRSLTAFINKIAGRSGVHVDAGFKNGISQIAIVLCTGHGCAEIVTHRTLECRNINEAELLAIKMAYDKWPDRQVFSDSHHAATAAGAKWIPRERNKIADALGNLRGVKKPKVKLDWEEEE